MFLFFNNFFIVNPISDVDSSLALFREMYTNDPYRLDNWDVYSHLLYLKEKRMELAKLAQKAISIDKYRVETCCVIGKCLAFI